MPTYPPDPEIPYPFPPLREPPRRPEPVTVPVVEAGQGTLRTWLVDQRRIIISGPLVQESTTEVAAQLMAFDGSSSRDVEMIVTSEGGPLPDVFPILDVLGLMRAPVGVTAMGAVGGTAVSLVAACTGERRATANATFSLRLDATQSIEGTAGEIVRYADELTRLRARYLETLSAATGQSEDTLAAEIDHGRTLDAEEAVTFGIIDTIVGRQA